MPATFIAGDLLNHPGLRAIAHGCNCEGVMGAGVAAGVREKYPACYSEYRGMCAAGAFKLGRAYPWTDGAGFYVFNLATQPKPGPTASIDAVRDSVRDMIDYCEMHGIKQVGLPRIGAGLGGLNWFDVKNALADLGSETAVELLVFEDFVPAR